MNLWPILGVGMLAALFEFRRRKLLRLFNPCKHQHSLAPNKDDLIRSLSALIDFLYKHKESQWMEVLFGIRSDLQHKALEEEALERLSNVFGGMGSLNDLVFEGPEADQESCRLLDAVFRDMKLYHGTAADRIQWRKLEDAHKEEPPPRIKHAFRKDQTAQQKNGSTRMRSPGPPPLN
jgi:hypothetical protein